MGSSYPVLVFFFFFRSKHVTQNSLYKKQWLGSICKKRRSWRALEGPGGSSSGPAARLRYAYKVGATGQWHRLEKLSCTPSLQLLKSIINNHIIIYGNVYVCFLVSKKKKLIALNLNILDFDKQTKHTIDKRFTQSKAGHIETVGV